MPKYEVELADGRVFEVEADREPTLYELEKLIGGTPSVTQDQINRLSVSEWQSYWNHSARGIVDAAVSPVRAVTELAAQLGFPATPIRRNALNGITNWGSEKFPVWATQSNGVAAQGLYLLPLALMWIFIVKLLHGWRKNRARTLRASTTGDSMSGDDSLWGVRGWLRFFVVTSLFLGPFCIFGHASSFARIGNQARDMVSYSPAVLMSRLIWLHIATALFMAVVCAVVAVMLWWRKATALLWLRRFWWIIIAWQGFFVLAFYQINPLPSLWMIEIGSVAGLAISLLVWRAYFVSSHRVANTFGPWYQVAHRETTFWQEIVSTFGRSSPQGQHTGSSVRSDEAARDPLNDSAKSRVNGDEARWQPPPKALNPSPQSTETPAIPASTGTALLAAYSKVSDEQRQGIVNEALWLKCISEADGDETRATYAYYRERAMMVAAEASTDKADDVTSP